MLMMDSPVGVDYCGVAGTSTHNAPRSSPMSKPVAASSGERTTFVAVTAGSVSLPWQGHPGGPSGDAAHQTQRYTIGQSIANYDELLSDIGAFIDCLQHFHIVCGRGSRFKLLPAGR